MILKKYLHVKVIMELISLNHFSLQNVFRKYNARIVAQIKLKNIRLEIVSLLDIFFACAKTPFKSNM